jgi:hypothetical protein
VEAARRAVAAALVPIFWRSERRRNGRTGENQSYGMSLYIRRLGRYVHRLTDEHTGPLFVGFN